MEPALGPPFTYSEYWLLVWASAILGGVLYLNLARAHPLRALGLALMTVPAWTAVWGFIHSIPALADPDSFIPARSTYSLSSAYIRSLLIDIGYLGVGYLLWTHAEGLPRTTREIARRLRTSGLSWGPSEGRSMLIGWAWFPALLLGTIALDLFVRNQTPALINGDESQIWQNMTVFHALIISAAAGMTEELVYRGLLLAGGIAVLTHIGVPLRVATGIAVVVQAAIFGAAHGGYGTLYHVIGPLLFGLLAGVIAIRYGLWAAIIIHFLVDVFAFGIWAANNTPWFLPFLWVLLLTNVGVSLTLAVQWGLRRREAPA